MQVDMNATNEILFTFRQSIGGMPHAAIFLPDGTMFWHGDSTERDFNKALKEALASLKK